MNRPCVRPSVCLSVLLGVFALFGCATTEEEEPDSPPPVEQEEPVQEDRVEEAPDELPDEPQEELPIAEPEPPSDPEPPAPPEEPAEPEPYSVTFLHYGSVPAELPMEVPSVARFASQLDGYRTAWDEEVLVADVGDHLTWNRSFALASGDYEARAVSILTPDVVTLGLGDLSMGASVLARFVPAATVPVVLGNVTLAAPAGGAREAAGWAGRRSHVVEVGGREIGVVAHAGLRVASSVARFGTVSVDRTTEVTASSAAELANEGVTIVVALLYGGVDPEEFAAAVPEVDVVISAEADFAAPRIFEPGGDRRVVLASHRPGYAGFGAVRVFFDDEGKVQAIEEKDSGLILIGTDTPRHAGMLSQVVDPLRAAIEAMRDEVIGVAVDGLDGRADAVRTRETTMGNALADAYLWAAKEAGFDVDFALVPADQINGDVEIEPGGVITRDVAYEVLPAADSLALVENLTYDEVRYLFEAAVRTAPRGSEGFLQVAGVQVEYTTNAAPDRRVRRIRVAGNLLVNEDWISTRTFTAVVAGALAWGEGVYAEASLVPAERKRSIPIGTAEAFEAYVRNQGDLRSPVERRIVDLFGRR